MNAAVLDTHTPSRHLIRVLRRQPDLHGEDVELPESVLWRAYCELRRRGEDRASEHFLRSVRKLHRRRSLGSVALPVDDLHTGAPPVDDPMLSEPWKAYKRCICRATGAGPILNDIEAQIAGLRAHTPTAAAVSRRRPAPRPADETQPWPTGLTFDQLLDEALNPAAEAGGASLPARRGDSRGGLHSHRTEHEGIVYALASLMLPRTI